MKCAEFSELVESYLSDELLVETNHEVLRHLENCATCRSKLADLRELRAQLRNAVKNSAEMQIAPGFATRLRSTLHETASRPTRWERFKNSRTYGARTWMLAGACLLIVSVFGVFWLRFGSPVDDAAKTAITSPNRSGANPDPSESPLLEAVHIAWREIEHAAVGDHRDCALAFRLEEKPISLEKAAEKFGALYKDIDKAVEAALRTANKDKPEAIELVEAHSCVFQGRRFAHLVLRRRDHLISILVTNTDLPLENGERIFARSEGEMQTASFGVAHNAVFIVSDLTEGENMEIAKMVSPFIRQHIQKAEI